MISNPDYTLSPYALCQIERYVSQVGINIPGTLNRIKEKAVQIENWTTASI